MGKKVDKEEAVNRKGREGKKMKIIVFDLGRVILTLAFRMGEDQKA